MPKLEEKILLWLTDFIAIHAAFFLWAWLRKELGFFSETDLATLLYLSMIVYAFWFCIFVFFGLYGSWYAQSRLDEIIRIFKSITLGVFLIFLITFDLEKDLSGPPSISRMFIINYWLLLLLSVSTLRMLFRTFQRILISAGIGTHRTLIVGWGKRSWHLLDEILKFPALGYNVIGFIADGPAAQNGKLAYKNRPLMDSLEHIKDVIEKEHAQEVIFSMEGRSRKKVMEVIDQCHGLSINFKIVPDLYDIVMGQARTNQIYGLPLINITPSLMPAWEKNLKRIMDIVIAGVVLIFFAPLWLIIALAIKLDSPGPVFYRQKRVGKDEQEFLIYKFRSMIHNAESQSGPQWAQPDDPRVTRVGRIIRKLRLDEIPQFINVLKGEMSLIGPRPERPYFVEQFKHKIPFYSRRLKVKPGITGWAQIKGQYDTSIENVKTKLQYDLFYLENMSLRMDLKILLNTFYVMLMGKGH